MRIAIGSDHVGLTRKGALISALEDGGHVVLDLGAFSQEPVDYPDYARVVGQAVLRGFVEAGLLVCGSETGAAMAANKVRGVRAAPCRDAATARESREQLNANVLCLSARALDDGDAVRVALAWVNAGFSGDETHARQVAKLAQLDAGGPAERDGARPATASPVTKNESSAVVATSPAPTVMPVVEHATVGVAAAAAPVAAGATVGGAAVAGAAGAVATAVSSDGAVSSRGALPSSVGVSPGVAVSSGVAVSPSTAVPSAVTLPSGVTALIDGAVPVGGGAAPVGASTPVGIAAAVGATPSVDDAPHGAATPVADAPLAGAPVAAAPVTGAPVGVGEPIAVDASVGASVAPAPGSAATESPAAGAPPRVTRNALDLPVADETLAFLESQDFLDRLWVKDASLWRGDPDAIRNRLGWLTSPTVMRGHLDELKVFADEIRRLQFSQVVLLGVGGASLAGQVMGTIFPSRMGFPDLFVLDSSDPGAMKQTLDSITVGRTLFVVSTKSGESAETLAMYAYFRSRVEGTAPKAGMQFVAITDPGSPLERLAGEAGFRRTFLNSPSIGGRYSALSFFGLVPAALAGVDVKALLERAQAMVERCGDGSDNPGTRLGAVLAGLCRAGRDKITFVLSEPLRALGPWIEQLLAESLGKDGKGVVPIVDEPLGNPVVYGDDRVFVAITVDGDTTADAALEALDQAGHPVIRIGLTDPLDLGAEFFRWEMAAATAAAVLGVNPFDEPDVARAKEKTAGVLLNWRKTRRLPEWPVAVEEDAVALLARTPTPIASVGEGLAKHLAEATADDYVAFLAYLPPTADNWAKLQALRVLVRDRLRIATTVAFGPQYLHAAGQLHKGGGPNGVFIQIVSEDKEDFAVPGADYSFSLLKAAQALGDLEALREGGRRIIRLRLAGRPGQGLQQLLQIARAATRRL